MSGKVWISLEGEQPLLITEVPVVVTVIVVGIGHDDTSSNPGLIAFHIALIPLGKV